MEASRQAGAGRKIQPLGFTHLPFDFDDRRITQSTVTVYSIPQLSASGRVVWDADRGLRWRRGAKERGGAERATDGSGGPQRRKRLSRRLRLDKIGEAAGAALRDMMGGRGRRIGRCGPY
jgi:hypothetical protein